MSVGRWRIVLVVAREARVFELDLCENKMRC